MSFPNQHRIFICHYKTYYQHDYISCFFFFGKKYNVYEIKTLVYAQTYIQQRSLSKE